MKQSVQILLLIVGLIPLFAGAREETMEQRKQRIMRKYLREKVAITYSELTVPDEEIVGEELIASEKFKQPQVDFKRQEVGSALPPPVRRRPTAPVQNSNWLLSENSELNDPYANPFAPKDSANELKKKDDWTSWGVDKNVSPYEETTRGNRFERSGSYGSSANSRAKTYEATQQGIFNPRDQRAWSAEGQPSEFQPGKSSVWGGRGQFGQPRGVQPSESMDSLSLSREKISNPALNRTRLQTPFTRESPSQSGRSRFNSKSQSYTPYKSSFEAQREQRGQQWGGYHGVQPEFQKKNSFQQWKDKSPVYNPTADDAYIQEMMPKLRR